MTKRTITCPKCKESFKAHGCELRLWTNQHIKIFHRKDYKRILNLKRKLRDACKEFEITNDDSSGLSMGLLR